jgi:predicted CopG family antitoxin
MIRVFSLVLLLFLLIATVPVAAEYYKYLDEKGNIGFTDDITRILENKRHQVEIRMDRPGPAQPASKQESEKAGREEFNRLLKDYFEEKYRAKGSCRPETDAEIGEVIEYAWNGMSRAMMAGKLEKALSHFSVFTRDEYRRRLSGHSWDYLQSLFGSIDSLEVSELTKGRAECGAIRKEGSRIYSWPVRFVKDPDCTWRIYEF